MTLPETLRAHLANHRERYGGRAEHFPVELDERDLDDLIEHAEANHARGLELRTEVERLRAALLEERAARLYYRVLAENGYGVGKDSEWQDVVASNSQVYRDSVSRYRAQAPAELVAERLLPQPEE